jgi:hypothetical protein
MAKRYVVCVVVPRCGFFLPSSEFLRRCLAPAVSSLSIHAREFKEILTPGPKGQETCPVDVRAEARTYPNRGVLTQALKALLKAAVLGKWLKNARFARWSFVAGGIFSFPLNS